MKKRLTAAIICAAMLLAGCSSGSSSSQSRTSAETVEASEISSETESSETETAEPPSASVSDTFAASVNQFNWKLFSEAAQYKGSNLFYSPFSISTALAMADIAANGDTKAAIEEVLGIDDLTQYCEDLQAFIENYAVKEGREDDAQFICANSLWLAEGLTLSGDYEEKVAAPLEKYFGAEILTADFAGNIDKVREEISAWVKEHTNEMIPDYKSISGPETVADFLNAVYFYGEWQEKFSAQNTFDSDFYGASATVSVPMMHSSDIWARCITVRNDSSELTGIALPYIGGAEMDIFLAPEGEDIVSAFTELNSDQLFESLSTVDEQLIRTLQLPKFTMDLTFEDLDNCLINIGLGICFSSDADFSSLSDELCISSIAHRARIEVDEEGSRAAAVTEIAMKATGMLTEGGIDFIVDRPFIYVIRDTGSGTILFTGLVNDL
ncbi:MAG: serpin family protein [Lachnospiraceae bacterium]|nr:serpin family protein [Lachnospiraceae bacterium]